MEGAAVQLYFTREEWEGFSDYEKDRLNTKMELFYAMQKFGFSPPLPDFVVEWTSRAKAKQSDTNKTKREEGHIKKTSSTTELAISRQKRKRKVPEDQNGSNKRVMLKRQVQLVVQCKEKTDHHVNSARKMHSLRLARTKQFKNRERSNSMGNRANFKHILTTDSHEPKFECADCKYKTKWKWCLDLHILAHGSVKNHACAHCTYCTEHKGSLRVHMHTHTGEKPYKCHLCAYKCTQKGNLASHVRNMHTKDTLKRKALEVVNPMENIVCDQLDEFNPLEPLAKDHHINVAENKEHGESSNSMDNSDTIKGIVATNTLEQKNECSNSIKNSDTIKGTNTIEKKIEYSKPMDNSDNIKHTMATQNHEQEFKYSNSIKSSDTLKHIVTTHTNETKIEYSKPMDNSDNIKYTMTTQNHEQEFKYSNSMDNSKNIKHITKTHSSERKFACNDCEYKAKRKGSLQLHVMTHGGVKPFACALCGFRAVHKGSLRVHIRKHTGEKPYKCLQCAFTCTHKGNLASHVRHMHTKECPFSCTRCEYKCKRSSHLDRHMLRHEAGKSRYKDAQKSKASFHNCHKTVDSSRSSAQLIQKFACLHLNCEFRCKQPGQMWKHIAAKHAS